MRRWREKIDRCLPSGHFLFIFSAMTAEHSKAVSTRVCFVQFGLVCIYLSVLGNYLSPHSNYKRGYTSSWL